MSPPISYDLEFRAIVDEAWYGVAVVLSGNGRTLTVLADGLDHWKPEFRARDFKSSAELDEFAARFRPVSHQLQDNECRRVTVGMTVCASLSSQKDDLRYYDAVVEGVQHKDHKMTNGEEECLCSFLLCWKHGPRVGYIDLGGIADICLIEPASVASSEILSFINLTKERILATNPRSFQSLGYEEHMNHLSLCERGSQDIDLESNLCQIIEDKNGENIGASDPGKSGPCYFVLIDNLDQNMSTSAMSQFLLRHTLVSSRVRPYPRRSSVPFGSAIIATDSREDIEKIYAFLANPNHLIVSSQGRPWVVYEKVFDEPCGAIELLSQSQNEHVCQGAQELQLVHSGTEAYDTALRARDMFLQFLHHMDLVYANLVLKQEVILRSFDSGNAMMYWYFSIKHLHVPS